MKSGKSNGNKSMKWHLKGKSEYCTTSNWFKTRADAEHEIERLIKNKNKYTTIKDGVSWQLL